MQFFAYAVILTDDDRTIHFDLDCAMAAIAVAPTKNQDGSDYGSSLRFAPRMSFLRKPAMAVRLSKSKDWDVCDDCGASESARFIPARVEKARPYNGCTFWVSLECVRCGLTICSSHTGLHSRDCSNRPEFDAVAAVTEFRAEEKASNSATAEFNPYVPPARPNKRCAFCDHWATQECDDCGVRLCQFHASAHQSSCVPTRYACHCCGRRHDLPIHACPNR
jgi:hypothetical protein